MIESRIDLLFGKGHLPVTVPAGVHPTIIRKGAMQKLSDPSGAIADALARPIGAPALAALAQGKKSACILICDITRPVPNRLFLRPMVQTSVPSRSWSPPACTARTRARSSPNWWAIPG